MKKPNTTTLLDISTGHLSLATRERLEQPNASTDLGITLRPYGYFLAADPDAYKDVDLPPDLFHCVRYAHANGAAYLLFDQDAPQQPGLPWYEDGNLPDLAGTGLEPAQLATEGDVVYVDPATVDSDSLRVEPTWTVEIGDRDVEAVEGALWVGVGPASVRIRFVEGEGVRVSVFPRGQEMEEALHEASMPEDLFTVDPKAIPEP